jgi:hypothetical protein
MTHHTELLPESLLWVDGGHLSDEALSAYADGQVSILPVPVLEHAECCDRCVGRLGSLALASWALDGAMREAAQVASPAAAAATSPSTPPASAPAFRPPPWWVVLAALVLAALTSLPSAGAVMQWARTAWAVWPRLVPQLPALGNTLRGLLVSALGPLGHALPLLVSFVLLLTGWAVASAALKIRSQKGTIL